MKMKSDGMNTRPLSVLLKAKKKLCQLIQVDLMIHGLMGTAYLSQIWDLLMMTKRKELFYQVIRGLNHEKLLFGNITDHHWPGLLWGVPGQ